MKLNEICYGLGVGAFNHEKIIELLLKNTNEGQVVLSQSPSKIKQKHQANKNLPFKCPNPEVVIKNKGNAGTFSSNGQTWSNDYMGWPLPKKMTFMQVVLSNNGEVSCYYNWPSPKEQGTKLWMTVKLNPDVTQKLQPFGGYWNAQQKGEDSRLCSAGIDACVISSKNLANTNM